VRPTGATEAVHLFNDLPAAGRQALPSSWATSTGRRRTLLLTIDLPAMTALGIAQVCELELLWVDINARHAHRDHPAARERGPRRRRRRPRGRRDRAQRACLPARLAREEERCGRDADR
jgi:hypothetical protein